MLNAKELEKSLLAAGHKIVPDTLSKEELRYYDTHHFGKAAPIENLTIGGGKDATLKGGL